MDGSHGNCAGSGRDLAAVSDLAPNPAASIRAAQVRLERATAKAGLENDPLGDCFAALTDCLGAMGELHADMKAGGARGLTPEGEAALVTALVQRVGREVGASLVRRARADLIRTGLFGAALLVGATALAGSVAYATGRIHGAAARVAELCQGTALQAQPKGGVSCSFWFVAPDRK